MIIKSMSRKEPSFGELASYMSSEKSDSHYDIHHHCYSRNQDDLVSEFTKNGELLRRRKNGNYLYHDIISITADKSIDRKTLKEGLRDISLRYIQDRCPKNMVYGCLHEDHDNHLHYHLMISANQRGEKNRYRLTKKQFDQVKRDLETHVLAQYPQLKQTEIITATSHEDKMSVKGDAMKRRTGSLPQREEVQQTIKEAMAQTSSMDNFCFFLNERGYDFYVRGKNFGVKVTHEDGKSKSYRFSTLGVHEEFQAFQDGQYTKQQEEAFAKTAEETPTEASGASETGTMTDDTPQAEKTAERVSEEGVFQGKTESQSEEPAESEKPAESENDGAGEKEKEEFREQLKRQREAGGRAEDESGSSI